MDLDVRAASQESLSVDLHSLQMPCVVVPASRGCLPSAFAPASRFFRGQLAICSCASMKDAKMLYRKQEVSTEIVQARTRNLVRQKIEHNTFSTSTTSEVKSSPGNASRVM